MQNILEESEKVEYWAINKKELRSQGFRTNYYFILTFPSLKIYSTSSNLFTSKIFNKEQEFFEITDKIEENKNKIKFFDLKITNFSPITIEDLRLLKYYFEEFVSEILKHHEDFYISRINSMEKKTPTIHELDYITGIGSKLKEKIIQQRANFKFTSYSDFENRIGKSLITILQKHLVLVKSKTDNAI